MLDIDHVGRDIRARLCGTRRASRPGTICRPGARHWSRRRSENLRLNLDSVFQTLSNESSKRRKQKQKTEYVCDDPWRHQQAAGDEDHDSVRQSCSWIFPAVSVVPGFQTLLFCEGSTDHARDQNKQKRVAGPNLAANAQQQPQLDERHSDQQKQQIRKHVT